MTLPRVLEPEIMDTSGDAIEYDQMDHSAVNRCFVEDLSARGSIQGEVLDFGTGTALIPIELCNCHDEVRVMATDLAVHMLEIARINVELANLTDRVMLDRIDAKCLPFDGGRFDVVMSNSIVHHLVDPMPVLREALRVVKRGGLIFFRDLLRPDNDAEVRKLVASYAHGESQRARQLFDDSLRAALTLNEIRSHVDQLGFDPGSVEQTSDRHWTWVTEDIWIKV